MELTISFESLLLTFSPVFTEPSFATFRLLMTGWILSMRHRYVTDLIVSSNSVDNGHFSDYHRFFSHAVWNLDHLWKLLAQLIVQLLIARMPPSCSLAMIRCVANVGWAFSGPACTMTRLARRSP